MKLLKNIPQVTKNAPVGQIVNMMNEMHNKIVEYQIVVEQEKTKREAIKAQKEVLIEKIKTQRDILEKIIDNTFSERKDTFNKLFSYLDKAINEKSLELLNSITLLIKTQIENFSLLNNINEFKQALTSEKGVDF